MEKGSNPIPAMANTPLQPERPVVMIGQQYLTRYPVDLIFPSNKQSVIGDIKDVNDTVIFKIKSKIISIPPRRFLKDAAGNILVTLRKKVMSMHKTWEVFRGESTEEENLLFNVKKSSTFGEKTQLDVFLASNISEQVSDFKIEGRGWKECSCVIFQGDGASKSIIAQMHRGHNLQTALDLLKTDNFAVTIYPNVDYAFIMALMVVLVDINYVRPDPRNPHAR